MANTTGQKFGGRAKGTPNKLTADIRDLISEFVRGEIDHLERGSLTLSTKERIDMIAKLLPYVLPKISEDALTIPEPRQLVIQVLKASEDIETDQS